MTNYLPRVIGSDSINATPAELRYRDHSDVIGAVERSSAGNALLRIGSQNVGEPTWEGGKAHVVLTPAERDALIAQQEDDEQVDDEQDTDLDAREAQAAYDDEWVGRHS